MKICENVHPTQNDFIIIKNIILIYLQILPTFQVYSPRTKTKNPRKMRRRQAVNGIHFPSRVEGWLDYCGELKLMESHFN